MSKEFKSEKINDKLINENHYNKKMNMIKKWKKSKKMFHLRSEN